MERKGYHIIISWKPGECTEEKAYQIIQEFCQEYLGENYDYVFGIHTDPEAIAMATLCSIP